MFSNILVPTDGSPLALSAVTQAVDFARDAKAFIIFITVIEPFRLFSVESKQLSSTPEDYMLFANAEASRFLTEAEMKARQQGVACRTLKVESDDVYSAIIKAAIDNGCDLIAIASHGRGGAGALLIGSVTGKILSHSRIPVLVYR
ncbi:universal stress protein [Rhizobium leucaenae]|uniref:universal stress protein n=1 Tax=Rhizobium leucaenae TaxID=29450 RepID=UPI0007EE76D5|nr:universal stress protein [Rhizobium leucaenae]MBB6303734.1 nucleotide-binding universal stress UspA family protein [Rhizobium leucaenae]